MSGVKHTPGPWRIDVNGSENWTVDYEGPSSTFMTICANGRREPVGFAVEPTAWGNDDEIEANARLIAAAPSLLEALTEARLTLSLTRTNIMVEMKKSEGTAYRWEGVPEALQARIIQCDDAIARARGEQSPNHSDQKEVGNG